MLMPTPLLQLRPVSRVKSHASPESAAAVTVMVATVASGQTALSAVNQAK